MSHKGVVRRVEHVVAPIRVRSERISAAFPVSRPAGSSSIVAAVDGPHPTGEVVYAMRSLLVEHCVAFASARPLAVCIDVPSPDRHE